MAGYGQGQCVQGKVRRQAYPRANLSPVILESLREYFQARRDGGPNIAP